MSECWGCLANVVKYDYIDRMNRKSRPISWIKAARKAFEQFPHPTYKGGTTEAYQAFAQVFLDFFSRTDNFEFLKQKGLLNIRLTYKFPSGQLGLDTTFDKLSGELADPSYLPGFLSTDIRNKLMTVHQMIHDAL